MDSDIVVVHLGFPAHERVEFSADYSWVSTGAAMDAIGFAPLTAEQAACVARADVDFTEVHELSDIEVNRTDFTFGTRLTLPYDVLLQFFCSFADYEDDDPILVDETGKYQVIYANVGWRF